eukprot:181629-Pyramimonas_sp.AAC.1
MALGPLEDKEISSTQVLIFMGLYRACAASSMSCKYARAQLTLCMHPWRMERSTEITSEASRPKIRTLPAVCTHMPMYMVCSGYSSALPR